MVAVGGRAFTVAMVGVVSHGAGLRRGRAAASAREPVHLFLGAMLSATSVGITAGC
jgi:hypothetical protein